MKLDLYQARSGKIYLRNGSMSTPLTKQQLEHLKIHVFELDDFDFDSYKTAYAEYEHHSFACPECGRIGRVSCRE